MQTQPATGEAPEHVPSLYGTCDAGTPPAASGWSGGTQDVPAQTQLLTGGAPLQAAVVVGGGVTGGGGGGVVAVFSTQLPFTQCMPGTLPGQAAPVGAGVVGGGGVAAVFGTQLPFTQCMPGTLPGQAAPVGAGVVGGGVEAVFGTQLPFTQCMPGTLPGQVVVPPPPPAGAGAGEPGGGNASAGPPLAVNPFTARFDSAPKFGPLKATSHARAPRNPS